MVMVPILEWYWYLIVTCLVVVSYPRRMHEMYNIQEGRTAGFKYVAK